MVGFIPHVSAHSQWIDGVSLMLWIGRSNCSSLVKVVVIRVFPTQSACPLKVCLCPGSQNITYPLSSAVWELPATNAPVIWSETFPDEEGRNRRQIRWLVSFFLYSIVQPLTLNKPPFSRSAASSLSNTTLLGATRRYCHTDKSLHTATPVQRAECVLPEENALPIQCL